MCNCPSVHFYEVEFKLAGMTVVPTHKNCGDSLNEEQMSQFNKELIKYTKHKVLKLIFYLGKFINTLSLRRLGVFE